MRTGVVLALNARQLVRNMSPILKFLDEFDLSQILVWTGSGELPIPRRTLQIILNFFEKEGVNDRIGFDCKVSL